jgi:hypothetical protein
MFVIAAIGFVAVIAASGTVATGIQRGPSVVSVGTSGDDSERHKTIPIGKRPGSERRTAISLSLRDVADLHRGDRLKITAELEVTTDCRLQASRCIGRPYQYAPRVGTRLILARRAGATHGQHAKAITKRHTLTCRQREPNRDHHCVSVIRHASYRFPVNRDPPCALSRCRVNLVVDASNPDAHSGEVVILGITRPSGKIVQDKGRVNVARFRGGDVSSDRLETTARLRSRMDVEEGSKKSIYSLRLNNLQRHEQFTVSADAITAIGHLPYSVFIGSQLILARHRGDVRTTQLTRRLAFWHGEITESTGFNCTQLTTPCTSKKEGVLVIRHDAPLRNGRPVPLFINYVLRNAPKNVNDRPGDRVRIRPGGGITARRYAAAVAG